MGYPKIAHIGADNCPQVGIDGAFYARQYIGSSVEWAEMINKVRATDRRDYTFQRTAGKFIYVYEMGSRGEWNSVAFTTAGVAGNNQLPEKLSYM